MAKLSLLFTVLLASLSVSGAATSNELTKRGKSILKSRGNGSSSNSRSRSNSNSNFNSNFRSSSSINSDPVHPIDQDLDFFVCGGTLYGPEDFKKSLEIFQHVLLEHTSTGQFADIKYLKPLKNIPQGQYIGIGDTDFYLAPLIDCLQSREQHNNRDFVIIAEAPGKVVEVLTSNGEKTVRCEKSIRTYDGVQVMYGGSKQSMRSLNAKIF